jgi:hypothetical protein
MAVPLRGWKHRSIFIKVRRGKKTYCVNPLTREIVTDDGLTIVLGKAYGAIDSIGFMLHGDIPAELLAKLKQSTLLGNIMIRRWPVKMARDWPLLICLHQPTDLTFDLLEVFSPADLLIVRLDICLDINTKTHLEALQVADYLIRHTYQKWACKEPQVFWNSHYTNRRSGARNIATYADRLSKFSSKPCAHVEFRFQNAEICRKHNLDTIAAIRNLDLREFFKDNLKMIAPEITTAAAMTASFLERYPSTLTRLSSPYYSDTKARVYQLIKRGYTSESTSMTGSGAELLSANEAWAWERDALKKKAPRIMDNAAFLPTHVARYRKRA